MSVRHREQRAGITVLDDDGINQSRWLSNVVNWCVRSVVAGDETLCRVTINQVLFRALDDAQNRNAEYIGKSLVLRYVAAGQGCITYQPEFMAVRTGGNIRRNRWHYSVICIRERRYSGREKHPAACQAAGWHLLDQEIFKFFAGIQCLLNYCRGTTLAGP